MYLLVPIILTPFLGIFVDLYGQRVTLRMFLVTVWQLPCVMRLFDSVLVGFVLPHVDASPSIRPRCSRLYHRICLLCHLSSLHTGSTS
jgi:uncharacterized integral membrane protein